ELDESQYGKRYLRADAPDELLFCDNDTNARRLYNLDGAQYPKDAIDDYVVHSRADAVNPAKSGTKAAAHYRLSLKPGESRVLRLRLAPDADAPCSDVIIAGRIAEANHFYAWIVPEHLSPEARNVMRQSLAGLLWSKQFYHYIVAEW